jgi:hypothetical protein
MVSLPELKTRLLVAMSVPIGFCCGTAAPPAEQRPKRRPEPRTRTADAARRSEGVDGTRITVQGIEKIIITSAPAGYGQDDPVAPHRCGQDEYFETVCGGAANGCGPRGNSLTEDSDSRLVLTERADRAAWASFAYDLRATSLYQETGGAPPTRSPGAYCCYSQCTQLVVTGPIAASPIPPGHHAEAHCLPPPARGTRAPARRAPHCPATIRSQGDWLPLQRAETGECCYTIIRPDPPEPRHLRGRAARVAGRIREAGVAETSSWLARPVPAEPLTPELERRLASAWLREARMEHASIAAFARLSLELIALGAPAALLGWTHSAAADEVTHAEMTFALASRYAGRDLGPAPFAAARAMTATGDPFALALETFVDGCIGETVAACTAQAAAQTARDPAVRAVQQRIADDESRHAELAWATLAFCYRRAGSGLDAPLRAALSHAQAEDRDGVCLDCDLEAHGMPCLHTQRRVHHEVLAAVVAPCLESLLASG